MSDADATRSSAVERGQAAWQRAEPADRAVYALLLVTAVLLALGVLSGVFGALYVAGLLILVSIYGLLSIGLNVQWGYAGLINFSVVAFMGIGAYAAMLAASPRSPLGLGWHPAAAIPLAIAGAAVVAVLIGVPTLRLREDYLAIATLGLAEVVRLFFRNERQWTGGSRGINTVPVPLEWLPVGQRWIVLGIAVLLLSVVFLFVRRIHRSPWGRAQRTIRADEGLAQALGKPTFRLKMQAFVVGSVVMALAGVLSVFYYQYLSPSRLLPLETFYVWVALILGGTGSERGALLGGVIIVAIRQGTRFVADSPVYDLFTEAIAALGVFPHLDPASMRLLLIGALIVLVIRYRPEGLLPPREELIWPGAVEADATTPDRGRRRGPRARADAEEMDATAPAAGPGHGGDET